MKTRWQMLCGAAAGPLFVFLFTMEGFMRAGYSSIRHPVSSLAFGAAGWLQSANFIVTGALAFVFALGLRRLDGASRASRRGANLIAAAALCLSVTGLFLTDPFSGYPPGTPGHPLHYSVHGIIHTAFSSGAFVLLSAACFFFARHFVRRSEERWAAYSFGSGLGTLFFFFCEVLAMNQIEGFVEIGGLLQRVSILISMGWVTLLSVRLLRGRHIGRS